MKTLLFQRFERAARFGWTWRHGVAGVVLALLLTLALHAGPEGEDLNFMPLDEVKPGMKGIGKTVFRGTEVEEFEAEVLGVLKNISPRQHAILARLSGGPLEKTGVMGGMSGSPVYVDGRLIGAVSFSFPFSKEAVAGRLRRYAELVTEENCVLAVAPYHSRPATACIAAQFDAVAE